MTNENVTTNNVNVNINNVPIRRTKVYKDKRAYNRFRDRKNKKVYEEDMALNEATEVEKEG